ncbi:MAG: NUDIX hydrolase [Chloroflexi bacterium]|nr:NUDIX hydrolase [Chloroflexota bacterium]
MLDCSGTNPWQTRASRIGFDNGRLRVREDQVVQPDGKAGAYTYVELPDPVVAIVPVTDDGRVHLVRQWRYPWQQNSWEIPAGRCEPNEAPLRAAQRELAEEVGLVAECWEELSQGFVSAVMAVRVHLYLARGLTTLATPPAREGTERDMLTRSIPLPDALAAVVDGTIVHAQTCMGLLRVARLLGL